MANKTANADEKKYKVLHGPIRKLGRDYHDGETIELSDKHAKSILECKDPLIELIEEKPEPEPAKVEAEPETAEPTKSKAKAKADAKQEDADK